MDSVYSEGLDGEKSRPQWSQLSSSGCYLCAYCNCNLQRSTFGQSVFSDSSQLPYSLDIRKLSQCGGGKLGLCIARAEPAPIK